MRTIIIALTLVVSSAGLHQTAPASQSAVRSFRLQDLTWREAEQVMTPEAVVLIPLGAASLEHGPHLKLRSDQLIAEHLTARAAASASVVVAPTLTHHYYPAFLEYPGSTSLSHNSARDSTADIVRSLARFGPRRFYVLNTGMTTQPSLAASARALAADGILLRHTDWEARLDAASRGLREQDGGGHADEIETSMMLYIDRASVDMTRAVREYAPGSNPFVLTRRRETRGTYSETGVWGDPTRATAAKGQVLIVSTLFARSLHDGRRALGRNMADRGVSLHDRSGGPDGPYSFEEAWISWWIRMKGQLFERLCFGSWELGVGSCANAALSAVALM
jgi:creatinine amidohydrolase